MSGKCFSHAQLTAPNCCFREMAQLSMSIGLLGRAQFPPKSCTSDTLLLRCVKTFTSPYPPSPISMADYSQMPAQVTNQISPQQDCCVPLQQSHVLVPSAVEPQPTQWKYSVLACTALFDTAHHAQLIHTKLSSWLRRGPHYSYSAHKSFVYKWLELSWVYPPTEHKMNSKS